MITRSTTVQGGYNNATIPYTVPVSYYRAIVIGVHSMYKYPDSVTYNGVAATSVAEYNAGQSPSKRLSLWVLVAPATGTHDVQIVNNGGDFLVVDSFVTAFAGVNQTSPVNTTNSTSDSGGAMSLTLTTTVNDCFAITMVRSYDSITSYTNGTNCTFTLNNTYYDYGISPTSLGTAGAKTVSCSSGTDDQVMVSFALAPATLIPILDTDAVTNIALRSAVGNGEVEYDGDVIISERGFVISTNPNPTIADTKVIASGTVGVMSATINDLIVNQGYHIRAYATNTYGTGYGDDVTFSTLNITATDLIKDIGAADGEVYAVRIAVTGTLGTVTVMLGSTGDTDVFEATGGTQVMQGTYEGTDGLILRMSADFNGTIDNVQWVRVEGTGTIDWDSENFTTVFPIESEVFFKRIEDEVFNTYRLYRYLDLLFKDLDGYVTVTVKSEANDAVTTKSKEFVVGNTSNPASPFSKKRISFLCKDQAIIIGLSNASLNETFAIAKFVFSGHKRPRKLFGADKIISVG